MSYSVSLPALFFKLAYAASAQAVRAVRTFGVTGSAIVHCLAVVLVAMFGCATVANAQVVNGGFEIRTPGGAGSGTAGTPTGNCVSGTAIARYAPAPWGIQATPDYQTEDNNGFDVVYAPRATLPGFNTSPSGGCFMGFRSLSATANEG
ncbi:MAG: hypothetical protein WA822_12650, partial [Albidovulum sp.]